MIHEFTGAPKDLSELVDCTPQANANLFDMHIKPELRYSVDDGGEDVDMEYMMEMNFEYDHGNEAVCDTHRVVMLVRNSCSTGKGFWAPNIIYSSLFTSKRLFGLLLTHGFHEKH